MKQNSFLILLNIVFGFIIVIGAVISYDSCDGISKKQLESSYVLKTDILFNNLPKSEQKKYIPKKSLLLSDTLFADLSDNEKDVDTIKSRDKLREIIKNQRVKILVIQKDNFQLSNEKEDLLKTIAELKSKFREQRDRLLKDNMEQINDSEEQHYKNISELRGKINDLQRENIRLSQNNNIEIISLKAKINLLNDKLSKLKERNILKQ